MSEEQEILPCPFCGGPAELETRNNGYHTGSAMYAWVKCNTRGCNIAGAKKYSKTKENVNQESISDTKQRAINAWNTRIKCP